MAFTGFWNVPHDSLPSLESRGLAITQQSLAKAVETANALKSPPQQCSLGCCKETKTMFIQSGYIADSRVF